MNKEDLKKFRDFLAKIDLNRPQKKIFELLKVEKSCKSCIRGFTFEQLLKNTENDRFAYEKTSFLLIFGYYPDETTFKQFLRLSKIFRKNVLQNLTMFLPNSRIKNLPSYIATSVLNLGQISENLPNNLENEIYQGLNIYFNIPVFFTLAYLKFFYKKITKAEIKSLLLKEFSLAEGIISLKGCCSDRDVNILNQMLILHIEHGYNNNSTYASHIVNTTGANAYSSTAVAILSLSGPLHGGASEKAFDMIVAANISSKNINEFLTDVLNGKDFEGKIYGVGHAIYTSADPRIKEIKKIIKTQLSNQSDLLETIISIEKHAKEVIFGQKGIKVCPSNIDLYNGYVYSCLGYKKQMFLPLFIVARSSSWIAHRFDDFLHKSKLIRPQE